MKENRVIQQSLRGILKDLAVRKTLSRESWQWLREHSLELSNHLANKDREKIANAAFIAGQYVVARDLDIRDPLFRGQTALHLRDERLLEKVLNEIDSDGRAIKLALEMMKRRMAGDFASAVEIFENQIHPLLSSIPPECRAHIELMAGSPYFNSSKYSAARELYTLAFEYFSASENLAFAAVAAYNISVTSEYLGLKIESQQFANTCGSYLKKYDVPGLRQTLGLKEIQAAVAEKNYRNAIELANEWLKQDDLSLVARLLGLIAATQANVEIGHIIRARMHWAQAQEIVTGQKLTQYAPFLSALELEIANFSYSSTYLTRSRSTQDQRAHLLSKIMLCRQAILHEQKKTATDLLTEIKNEFPRSLLRRVDFSDLEIQLNGMTIDFEVMTARAAWALCLRMLETGDLAMLRTLLQACDKSEKLASGPLWSICRHIARGFLQLKERSSSTSSKALAVRNFLTALEQAQCEGLDRIANFVSGLLAFCDSQYELSWIHTLESLPQDERQNLRALLRRCLREDVGHIRWILQENGRRTIQKQNDGFDDINLVIDEVSGRVTYEGKTLPFSSRSLVFRLLTALARSGNDGLTKSEISSRVWMAEYDPLRQDPVIYSNIKRLRQWIDIEMTDGVSSGKYRLKPNLKWRIVTGADRGELNKREQSILDLLADHSTKNLQRLDVVKNLGLSPRTALRLLNDLVDKKYLVRRGQGRGVVYSQV